MAAFDLADLAACTGVDLWNYSTPDGRSLRAAVDYLAPYAGREEAWPHPELNRAVTIGTYEVLQRAAWAWQDASYAEGAARLAPANANSVLNLRLPPYGP